jgi:hypothetical protein
MVKLALVYRFAYNLEIWSKIKKIENNYQKMIQNEKLVFYIMV